MARHIVRAPLWRQYSESIYSGIFRGGGLPTWSRAMQEKRKAFTLKPGVTTVLKSPYRTVR